MEIKKHIGVLCILMGLLLTMDRTQEFAGVLEVFTKCVEQYWTILIFFLGLYLISSPKRKKK